MNNNRELLGAIADLSRSIEEVNGLASADYHIGFGTAPDMLIRTLATPTAAADIGTYLATCNHEEVTCSPCHAVTHGMYSVNSAKIYI